MAISGVREVRQFGAKGDGTGDDTEAVKKAIASLPRYGGVLYFPPGLYLLSECLRLGDRPVVVRGDGVGVTRLIWTANSASSGICVTQSNQQHLNTDFTHVERLSLWTRQLHRGVALTIDLTGQIDAKAGCVVSRVSPRICVEHVEIRGESFAQQAWQAGVHLINGHHSTLSNLHIVGQTDPGGAGMASAAGIHLDGTGKPTEIQISQCWVFNHARGIYMTGNGEGVKVSQCDLVMNGLGVHIENCIQFNMSNSHVNSTSCILLRNTVQSSINNCLLYKCGHPAGAQNGHGVQIEGGSFHNIVANCTFVNIAPPSLMHAVVLGGNSHHCLVEGNIFSNAGDGVLCLAGARYNLISGNVYDNPGLVNRFRSEDSSNTCMDGDGAKGKWDPRRMLNKA